MLYYKYDENGYYVDSIRADGFFKQVPRIEIVTEKDADGNEISVEREVFDLVPYMPDGITDIRPQQPMFTPVFDRDKQIWLETGSPPQPDVEALRTAKKQEIGKACTATIYAGIEVAGERYSLTEHDQIELMAQLAAVRGGAETVPYHADGELCGMYAADVFISIAEAATAHIFYHRTYCNHLNWWISYADGDELRGITYGADLPDDLARHMAMLLEQANGGGDDE